MFITADPGTCFTGCNNVSGTITVTFTNLKLNGTSIGNPSYTETGIYNADYATQTDSVDWTGAVAMSGFPLDQDGVAPLVYTLALPGVDLFLTDGADWDVQTRVAASLVDPTPLPATLPLFAGGLGVLGLITRRRKRKVAAVAG